MVVKFAQCKEDNGKIWVEVLIVTQQEKWHFVTCKKRGSDRIYVLIANNDDVNLVET